MQLKCKECGKEFITFPSRLKRGRGKFCSNKCAGVYNAKVGKTGFKKGHQIKTPIEARKKQGRSLSKTFSGEGNPMWRGDKIGRGVHTWVMKQKGRASEYMCWFSCGKMGKDWANLNHKYKRIADDYQPMCRGCHMKYDFKMGFRTGKKSKK